MINSLVMHKKLTSLGIGCIAKELKNSYQINFGTYDVKKVAKDMVNIIDTTHCKTIPFSEYQSRIIKEKSTLNDCIVGNELRHYVGIGWTTTRVVTLEDLQKYPRVI